MARTNNVRKDYRTALLYRNAAALLKRISQSRGSPSLRDCAMAGIYADQFDRRKSDEQRS